jgi:hypothetical protein
VNHCEAELKPVCNRSSRHGSNRLPELLATKE